MKIYTRTGDKGETGYIGGRISKSSELMELIGTVDELNAVIGVVVSMSQDQEIEPLTPLLIHNQNVIFNCGALVADINGELKNATTDLVKEVSILEKEIDTADAELLVLQNFILPGGSQVAAHLHLARTVCRRAERNLVALITVSQDKNREYLNSLEEIGKYLNRLSDWLFVYARWVNKQLRVIDQEWNKLN